jgi:Ca2+-transporting ATPase
MSQWHSKEAEEVVRSLGVNAETGLTNEQAAQRLAKVGLNKLVEEKEIRFLAILREEITEPMILLLLAVGVLYGILDPNIADALTIIAVVTILVLVEVWNEYRAKRSIAALRKLASPTTIVLRNGKPTEVQTTNIVPGDLLLLKPGQRVPADARLLDAVGLEVDESSFTGESFPAAKDAALVLPAIVRSNEQQNMVFAGTVVTKGRAKAVVTATGVQTELGRITGITKAAKEPKTPLQLSMNQLSKILVWIAVFFSILIPALEFLRGGAQPTALILTGLALAFVVIPEEMPIIITMVLGIGAYALSKKNALVKRLRAAETLGNVTVIATDKTGTITEGKMRVESLYFDGRIIDSRDFRENEREALKTALLASDSAQDTKFGAVLSNPMSQAILETLKGLGAEASKLRENWKLKDELSFDNKRKLASYLYEYGKSTIVLSSGAPENVLANSTKMLLNGSEAELSDERRKHVAESSSAMAQAGQRLLGFSYRRLPSADEEKKEQLERNLVFVGIVGFIDPPRPEVENAIAQCQKAGIKVVMVTGDHPETARAIAAQVGIESAKVLTGGEIVGMTDEALKTALRGTFIFARVTPEDKLRLVRLLRENGEIVAVTGDGVNDAPALKEAHIGVAMGVRGTDVAKETADMVLADDNFATIEVAVKEGRKLFSNLKKGVRYYLACKVAVVSIFLLPIALGIPMPFNPIQLIVLELFMDLAASATFVAEPEEEDVMNKPPIDPKEKFMNRTMLMTIALGALSLFAAVSATYLFTWFSNPSLAYAQRLVLSQTVAFATWMVGHIFLALNFRSEKEPLIKLGLFSNRVMILWALLAVVTLLVGTNLPFVNESLRITSLSLWNWALVIGVAFVATFWMELKKLLKALTSMPEV